MNDIVCVIHEDGSYAGAITYYRLLYAVNVQEAVSKECVVFDEDVWENARHYFAYQELSGMDEHLEQRSHRVFGKPVYSPIEAMRSTEDIAFIEVTQKCSAWGAKAVDYYDYIGLYWI